jgi:hypothetical protein
MFEKTLKIELSPIPQAYHLNNTHNKEIEKLSLEMTAEAR